MFAGPIALHLFKSTIYIRASSFSQPAFVNSAEDENSENDCLFSSTEGCIMRVARPSGVVLVVLIACIVVLVVGMPLTFEVLSVAQASVGFFYASRITRYR